MRQIVDICIRCESPIPGPPGPPGPQESTPEIVFGDGPSGTIDNEVPPGTENSFIAFCSIDTTAIGGSFGLTGDVGDIQNIREGLTDNNGYFVNINNGGHESVFVDVFVTCVKLVQLVTLLMIQIDSRVTG